jgi:hypothetical protein
MWKNLKRINMATRKQKLELIETLKAKKRTYEIMLSGYGGEIVLGSITKDQYEFWKDREDLDEHAYDWGDELKIPEEMRLVDNGNWYDLDDYAHECGCEFSSVNRITVYDKETAELVFECSLENGELEENGIDPDGFAVDEIYLEYDTAAEYAFIGQSIEKGVFATFEVEEFGKFDPRKLSFSYIDVEGWPIVNGVSYQSIILDDTGGYSTTGKSSEFKVVKVDRQWKKSK